MYTHTKMDEFSEKFQRGGEGSFPIKKKLLQIFAMIKGTSVMNSRKKSSVLVWVYVPKDKVNPALQNRPPMAGRQCQECQG